MVRIYVDKNILETELFVELIDYQGSLFILKI